MKKNNIEIKEDSNILKDEFGNEINVDAAIYLAEQQIETARQDARVNFRWSSQEVARAKRIASRKGISTYQTYMKSVLKQQMDKDEKELEKN